jgi:hypothetical protein
VPKAIKLISATAHPSERPILFTRSPGQFRWLSREAFQKLSDPLFRAIGSSNVATHLSVGIQPHQFARLEIDQASMSDMDAGGDADATHCAHELEYLPARRTIFVMRIYEERIVCACN